MLEKRKQLLRHCLKDADPGVRQAAAASLETLESAMELPAILASLKSGGRGEKVKALFALERIQSQKVFAPLLAALKVGDEDLRSAAIQVLARKRNPKVLGNLARCLKDRHPAVRVHAAEALGEFHDPRLVPYLGALVTAADSELVKAAVRSLAKIGAAEAEGLIAPLLDHQDAQVRLEAARALGSLEI